jgi:hypothetical protein
MMSAKTAALTAVSSLLSLLTPLIASPALSSQCTYSFWVWQGGERVKVCCNQQNFCVTKFGIYSQ